MRESARIERHLETSYWPAVTDDELQERTVGDLLKSNAEKYPERIALVEGVPRGSHRRRWSYREFFDQSTMVAKALLSEFSPGERVAVWSPNCAEWVFLQHGASLAGLVLVTVNPAYLESEVEYVLKQSGAAGLFHQDTYRGQDHKGIAEKLTRKLDTLRATFSFSNLESFVAQADQAAVLPEVKPRDTIQIQFTSGTTGKPKGACLHHIGLMNAARFAANRSNFQDGGVWATAMPLFHVGGSSGSQLGAFSFAGTFVLMPEFDAGEMLALIESEGVQHLHAVPTMVKAMLADPSLPDRNLKSLRTIMSGGSPVPAALVRSAREAFGCRFTITFGQTELCGVLCQTHVDDEDEVQATTIGQPAPLMEVKIADPETGQVLPIGAYGEIWARGYQVMAGYFDRPSESQTTLTEEGWLKTGDQAAMNEQGYLRITGRLKDCIIRGGENIYPREIEDVLEAHPAILQAVVVGYPDDEWGEIVAAAVKLDPAQARPDALDLFKYCRQTLAFYKSPVRWYFVESFPLTSSNKVRKSELRTQLVSGQIQPEAFEKPVRGRGKVFVKSAP